MSNILNSIKQTIASAVKVEVKSPVFRSGKQKFPVLVTDVSNSFTAGWFVQYNPVSQENGTRLYDGSETFSELYISRFTELKNLVETANYYFLMGEGVETIGAGRKRAIYQPTPAVRLTVTSQAKSVSVVVIITDESSPFHMMSIPFTVVASNANDGSYYVIGTDNERWDRNTDTFKEFNAYFAPSKARFYRVHQQTNGPAMMKAKILVNSTGQLAINQDRTFQVDVKATSPEYIQTISNEFKALAYIYEQNLMTIAFDKAIAQGLPVSQNNQQAPSNNFVPPTNGFVPSFSIGGAGAPNPGFVPQQNQPPAPQPDFVPQPQVNNNMTPPVPGQQQSPQLPIQGQQPPAGNFDDELPWTQN